MDETQARRTLDALVKTLMQHGGSDLFIAAGSAPALSVNGELIRVGERHLTPQQAKAVVLAAMTPKQCAQFEAENEVNFALHYPDMARFRVSVFRQRGSAGMVMRLIPGTIPDFDALHLPPILRDVALLKRGLVLILGATGSGKSTTLAAMIDHRNQLRPDHIMTVEDPIEYFHTHGRGLVNQREVGLDTSSYAVALRNALRQRPDVILIGEIRDEETMAQAISFAETGHLCLSTLHANNADQAFDRIVNFFPEDRRAQVLMDLSFNMQAFVSQRLLPRADAVGLIPAVEVLLNTPLISKLVFEGRIKELKHYMSRSGEPGMQTFDQSLLTLYRSGRISEETALRNADSVNDVRLGIRQALREAGETGQEADTMSLAEPEPDEFEGHFGR